MSQNALVLTALGPIDSALLIGATFALSSPVKGAVTRSLRRLSLFGKSLVVQSVLYFGRCRLLHCGGRKRVARQSTTLAMRCQDQYAARMPMP